ncbi:UNVERIFIED_ORG: UDP-2,3-diacylglucosamine pyrophosphatase LpxH [Paraburkholderia sediminicola]|uniref:metallophosphoesterase n=1 Tax=Paraburkholderia aspalathi TaxID=1324617 RepID=UPI002112AE38|nr:UDP-2,3-diacylglucosamine pyrophosphatase LpxH [Paraburkholderia sediminicola]
MSVYVISDLHIGAGPLDDCDTGCEDALVEFIRDLPTSSTDSSELVLNGDSFDFVQASPWKEAGFEASSSEGIPLCFDEETSLRKVRSIIDSHPRIFSALGSYVVNGNARLTILPGNHDVDLYWPSVRTTIAESMGNPANLHWHMERRYVPKRAPHVMIEHGHQYDPVNAFFDCRTQQATEYWGSARPPILPDVNGKNRLVECVGTRFLIRFLNELDSRYPFVDNIKPFSRFVSVFGSSIGQFRGGTARAAFSVVAFARFFASETFNAPRNLLSSSSTQMSTRSMIEEIEAASGGAFSRALESFEFDFRGRSLELLLRDDDEIVRVIDFVLSQPELLDEVPIEEGFLGLSSENDGTLSLAKGFLVDETKILKDAAARLLVEHNVKCVVMGHTHEKVDDLAYKNPGSWTRYWQMAKDDPTPGWAEMVKQASSLPLSPRYVVAAPDATTPVQMIDFK